MKIIAAAAICAHLWRSDALPSDSEPSNLRGDKARELVQACATTPRYYPDTSGGWDGGKSELPLLSIYFHSFRNRSPYFPCCKATASIR